MRGGPTPGPGRAPDPVGGELFRVSYRTQRGETFSKMFRVAGAAQRFAQRILDNDGEPRLHRVRLSDWTESHPCDACEYGATGHSHSTTG